MMKVDGRCHCGDIAYDAEIDLDQVAACHCTDCQQLSGSAFRVQAYIGEADFRLLKGAPKAYTRVADSGRKYVQYFCPNCGTPLYSIGERDGAKMYAVRLGAMRQRSEITPKVQLWRRSALPWVDKMPTIPAKATE